ncbi:MAG: hypothetical protein QM632_06450 [Micrococcaceae bacterium]
MTYKVVDTDKWTEEHIRQGITTQEKIDKGAEKLWRKCQRYEKRQEIKGKIKTLLNLGNKNQLETKH